MSNIIFNHKDEPMIKVSPDGLPSGIALIPAPLLTVAERKVEVKRARCSLACDGFFITSENRVRNVAFDKKGIRTTVKIQYRTCKTVEEAREVGEQIVECGKMAKEAKN